MQSPYRGLNVRISRTSPFSSRASPAKSPNFKDRYVSPVKSPIYSSDSSSHGSPMSGRQSPRKNIKQYNIKSKKFDAMNYNSSFPSKILDYSTQGILAVALANSVYIYQNNGFVELDFESELSIVDALAWYDTKRLIISHDCHVDIYNVFTSKKQYSFSYCGSPVTAISVCNDRVALGNAEGSVFIYNLTNEGRTKKKLHEGAVNSLAWSPDGALLASGDQGGILRVIGAGGYETSVMHGGPITSISWGSYNTLFTGEANATRGGAVRAIKLAGPGDFECVTEHTERAVGGVLWMEDTGLAVATGQKLEFWTRSLHRAFSWHLDGAVRHFAGTPEFGQIAAVSSNEVLEIMDVAISEKSTRTPLTPVR